MRTYIIIFLTVLTTTVQSQSVGINSDGSSPDSSSILDIKSIEKGVLIPRTDTIAVNAAVAPVAGLLIYQTTDNVFYFHNGSKWVALRAGSIHGMADSDEDTKIEVEANPDEDKIRMSLGGVEKLILDTSDAGDLLMQIKNPMENSFVGDSAGLNNGVGATSIYQARRNSGFGHHALGNNTTGTDNAGFGTNALRENTTGGGNTGFGPRALRDNTTGTLNLAVGSSALLKNTTGDYNLGVGPGALSQNQSGGFNIAIGSSAMSQNDSGHSNVVIGIQANFWNQDGHNNTTLGHNTLLNNRHGIYNVAMGRAALQSDTTGSRNVALGSFALFSNIAHDNLVAIGDSALFHNSIGATGIFEGNWNTAVGSKAMLNNTTGHSNTGLGYFALKGNTTGNANTAIGYVALYSNVQGSSNTGIGYWALAETTGSENTGVGTYSMLNNTIGARNTAIGYATLIDNTEGWWNTASGYQAMNENTTGDKNTAGGFSALSNNTTGNSNTAYGTGALSANVSGNFNTALGYQAQVGFDSLTNATAIGSDAVVNTSNSMVLGNDVNVGIGTSTPGNRLDIRSDGVADTTEIVLGLISNTSNRPVIQFSESDVATATDGMSIEYDGVGNNVNNKMHIRSITAERKFTFTSGGYLGVGTDYPHEPLEIAGTGRVFIGDGGGGSRRGLLIDAFEGGDYVRLAPFDYGLFQAMDLYIPGRVGIGLNLPESILHISGPHSNGSVGILKISGPIGQNIVIDGNDINADSKLYLNYHSGADLEVGQIGDGSVATANLWTTFSDRRHKKELEPIEDALDNLLALNGYTYYWKGSRDNSRQIGVIAQEVEELFPEIVITNDAGIKSVDYGKLVPVLIEAIKSQQIEIDRLAHLEDRINRLEVLIEKKD